MMPAFAEVYSSYAGLVRRVLGRLLPAGDVDDGVQEVFLKIHRSLPNFRGESSLQSWVYRISINTAQDLHRRGAFTRFWRAGASAPEAEDERPSAEDQLGDHEVLHHCLQRLNFRDRTVLMLFYWEDQPVAAIARHLDIPEGTVKSRLSVARQRLEGLLKEEGEQL